MHISSKKYQIISTSQGCVSNYQEESAYHSFLKANGFIEEADLNQTDFIIVNTCSHVQATKVSTENLIQKLRQQCKRVILTGCYPSMYRIENHFLKLDYFKPYDFAKLSKLLLLKNPVGNRKYGSEIRIGPNDHLDFFQKLINRIRPIYYSITASVLRSNRFLKNFIDGATVNQSIYTIRTGVGCMGECTFCGIKRSKGIIKSTPLDDILLEITTATSQGRDTVCFCGEDIGSWGQDIESSVVELLQTCLRHFPDLRIIIENFDPMWLEKYEEELVCLFSQKNFVCINVAVQTGSQKVLALMRRNYEIPKILYLIRKIKKANRSIVIKSNTIVAFPGETLIDFFMTVRSFFSLDGSSVDIFYPVEGTVAAKYTKRDSRIISIPKFVILQALSVIVVGFRIGQSFFYRWPTK